MNIGSARSSVMEAGAEDGDEDEHDLLLSQQPGGREVLNEAMACLEKITNSTSNSTHSQEAYTRWVAMIDRYLEYPTLLDPCLESMVSLLTHRLEEQWLLPLQQRNNSCSDGNNCDNGDCINSDNHGNSNDSNSSHKDKQDSPCVSVDDSINDSDNDTDDSIGNDDDDEYHHSMDIAARYWLSCLYILCKVRGRKVVQRFLPHQVHQVEPVWNALLHTSRAYQQQQEQQQLQSTFAPLDDAVPALWESLYVVWLWMGTLSQVPFDTQVFASTFSSEALLTLAYTHLDDPGPIREAVAACMASWLARPDWETTVLAAFASRSVQMLSDYGKHPTTATGSKGTAVVRDHVSIHTVLGVLQTWTALLKSSCIPSSTLIRTTVPLWEPLLGMEVVDMALLRKWLVKWWTRVACIHLPIRIASWRYQRGHRSLLQMQDKHQSPKTSKTTAINASVALVHGSAIVATVSSNAASTRTRNEDVGVTHDFSLESTDDDVDEILVPDLVEDAMGRLLRALKHSSTIVRWAAAKGVGRITERLPALCGEDVVDALVETMEDDAENDRYWHGACLALAELARRGLLLPCRLGVIVPYVIRAMQFDVCRRSHGTSSTMSVGAHVRDAACYCYWAFARAYSPDVLRPYLPALSQAVVLTSLFDREVNCRRAASAAFQESVGRQGATHFPHGIDILTATDYFSIGNRVAAYTTIAAHIAQFAEYTRPILRHLYSRQLYHWDIVIRKLSAVALGSLSTLDVSFVDTVVLPELFVSCVDTQSLNVRHGAVLGIAAILPKLCCDTHTHKRGDNSDCDDGDCSDCGCCCGAMSQQNMDRVKGIVAEIEARRLYRGRGGEIMRSAVCQLVESISVARIPLSVAEQVRLLDSVDASIPHPIEQVQLHACRALGQLTHSYFPVSENGPSERLQKRIVDAFVHTVSTSDNPAATRGYAMALGYLPRKLLAPNEAVLDKVLYCLSNASRADALVSGMRDAETRRNAMAALVAVLRMLTVSTSTTTTSLQLQSDVWTSSASLSLPTESQLEVFLSAFMRGLDDYNTDRRGDVGSWSRMAAMRGLYHFLRSDLLASLSSRPNATATLLVCAIVKQLSEKLDAVRQCAAECLIDALQAGICTGIGTGTGNESVQIASVAAVQSLRRIMMISNANDGSASESASGSRSESVSNDIQWSTWSSPEHTFPVVAQIALLMNDNVNVSENEDDNANVNEHVTGMMDAVGETVDASLRSSTASSTCQLPYFASVVSGLVVSAGCTVEAVRRPALLALSHVANHSTETINLTVDACLSLLDMHKSGHKHGHMHGHMLRHKYGHSLRVLLPTCRVLKELLLQAVGHTFCATPYLDTLLHHLLDVAAVSRDVHLLLSVVDVVGSMFAQQRSTADAADAVDVRMHVHMQVQVQQALPLMCELLGHSFPRVRGYTAPQLYMIFLELDYDSNANNNCNCSSNSSCHDSESESDDEKDNKIVHKTDNVNEGLHNGDAILSILLQFPWSADVDAETVHDQVCQFRQLVAAATAIATASPTSTTTATARQLDSPLLPVLPVPDS
jgi:tubulin-specific chaperone D